MHHVFKDCHIIVLFKIGITLLNIIIISPDGALRTFTSTELVTLFTSTEGLSLKNKQISYSE